MRRSITIELFSASSCNRCGDFKKRVQTLVEVLADDRLKYREVDVLQELDYAVSLRVLTTPAIAIDGELVFAGVPSEKKLRRELEKRLAAV